MRNVFFSWLQMTLRVVQWNTGGILNLRDEILGYLLSFDAILLQELHSELCAADYPEFHLFQTSPRPNPTGRASAGSAVLVSRTVPYVPTSLQLPNDDICWVKLTPSFPGGRSVVLASLYFFPPGSPHHAEDAPSQLQVTLELYRSV